jgi:hypothetical protein
VVVGYKPMDDGEITVLYTSNTPTLQQGRKGYENSIHPCKRFSSGTQ